MEKITVLPVVLAMLTGCASLNKADITRYSEATYPAKAETYQMDILDRGDIEREFTVIGEVRGKLEINYQSEQGVLDGLRAAAREMGGDALIDLQTRTIDESHDWIADNNTYYKAKVIVYE